MPLSYETPAPNSFSIRSSHQPSRHLSIFSLRLTLILAILLAGCTKTPVIQVSNERNQSGGYIHVNGQGFTPSQSVKFSSVNAPGHTSPLALGFTNTDPSGNFTNYVYEYRFESGSALPGCAYASNATVSVTITATDVTSNSPAFASVDVINCAW